MKDGFQKREILIQEQDKLNKSIKNLDVRLNELKFLYDQYFIGLERTEPLKLRAQVQDMIKKLIGTYIKSTAVKFKLNTLIAKHSSYAKLWDRILKEIEEGRYKRDIFRMKVKDWQAGMRGQKDDKGKSKEIKVEADPISVLFNKYIDSRKKTKEEINLKKENFAQTINKQVSDIKKKFKCKSVSFKIVVEKGKTKLKAVPKK